MKKSFNWSYVFSFFALVVSIVVLVKDCNQNQLIESLAYSVNAIEYNPRIDIVDTPYVKSFSFTPPEELYNFPPISFIDNHLFYDTGIVKLNLDSLKKGKVLAIFKSKEIIDSVMEIYKYKKEQEDTLETPISKVNYTITTEIKLKNIGNSVANIMLHGAIDTITGQPILREQFSKFVSGQKTDRNFELEPMDEFFQNELAPNNSVTIPISLEVYNINKEQKINLHFFVMYENEIGTIYDTYFWIVYENAPVEMEPIYSYHEPTKQMYLKFKLYDDIKSRFKVSITKVSYNTYDKDKSEEIKKWEKDSQLPPQQNNN